MLKVGSQQLTAIIPSTTGYCKVTQQSHIVHYLVGSGDHHSESLLRHIHLVIVGC